jgi:hypothetical protein
MNKQILNNIIEANKQTLRERYSRVPVEVIDVEQDAETLSKSFMPYVTLREK